MDIEVISLRPGKHLLTCNGDFKSALTLRLSPTGGENPVASFRALWHTNLGPEEVIQQIRESCVRLGEDLFDSEDRGNTSIFRRAEMFERGGMKAVQLHLKDLGQKGTDLMCFLAPPTFDRRFPSWEQNLNWLIASGGYGFYSYQAQDQTHPQAAVLQIGSNINIGHEVVCLYGQTALRRIDDKTALKLYQEIDQRLGDTGIT